MPPFDGSDFTQPRKSARVASIATGAFFAALWFLFAVASLRNFLMTGKPSPLTFGIAESLIAAFFLMRVPPLRVSEKLSDWIVAGSGTFIVFLLRPTLGETVWIGEALLLIGSAMQVVAILSLNRSFALVPALRELKTDGAYRFVRHPVYLSYLVSLTGFLVSNYSAYNATVIAAALSLMLWRIRLEERLLTESDEYQRYCMRVRWRLLPRVW